MKYISVVLSILFASFQITPNNVLEIDDLTKKGGKFITAEGELKVLVVFAKFKDDTTAHQFWPSDAYPSEMQDFIDNDTLKNSNHYLNLTNYYNQMSLGKLKMTGMSVSAVTPYPAKEYLLLNKSCINRAKANTDILKSIDDLIDYSEFDNWTYLSNYEHLNQPDGIVDMIIIIWRGLVFSNQWSGESSLGYGADFFVENNSKKIRMGYYYYPSDNQIFGSGVTVQYWGDRSKERNFKNCIHELAHWFIQADHPYEKYNHSFWGMLTLGCEGVCANSIEREKLGWINPTAIESSLTTDMEDFISNGNSYKYQFTNNGRDEYYYFENHQKLSIYDDATVNDCDKGVFILHLTNYFYKGDCVRVIPSDGFWDWEIVGSSVCWGNELPVLKKKNLNEFGFSHRDRIIIDNLDYGFLYCLQDEYNFKECNNFIHGYKFRSSFDTSYKSIFSPQINNNQGIKFIMEVISQKLDQIKLRFESLTVSELVKNDEINTFDFILNQNFPNPFNSSTNIQYEIANRQFVTLKVYDILGNELVTFVNQERLAGTYELTWNAANLPSGIYFYRLQAGDPSTGSGQVFVQTRKMILLK